MADILPFKRSRPSPEGKMLCKNGFHKWEVVQQNPFDVKQGKLVTVYRCKRCGATKSESR